ncbi:MAG: hypothetical protein AAF639_24595 [Chloroflexota bacterium]
MRIFEKNIPIFDEPDSIVEEEPPDVVDESVADVVARIKATPPNPAMITYPEASLAEALRDGPTDPDFDLAAWEQAWAMAEDELKRINQLDDIAEGRLEDTVDFGSYVSTEIIDEAKKLLKLYLIFDDMIV